MEENENLEMSLFNMDSDIELNLGYNPEDDDEINPEQDTQPEGDIPEGDNTEPNEDEDPEDVVRREGDDGGSDDDITSPNLYSSFASTLHDKGVLPSLDLSKTKIEDTDSLAEVIKGEIDSQTRQYIISKIGEDGFDALEKGVSLVKYQEHLETLNTLDSITDERLQGDLELAKRVIYQDYINQGLSQERAQRILQKTIDLGEEAILEDALESNKSLKVFETNRLEQEKIRSAEQKQQQIQEQEKIDNDLKNAIYNKKEFIKGIEVNKAIQDKVYEAITKVVGEGPNGVMENKLMKQRRENPIEFDAKLYYLFELTNGFEDFSKITKTVSSKTISDFEKVLRQTKFEESGRPSFTIDKDSYDSNLGSELVI